MSDKQLAEAVRHQREVGFDLASGRSYTGYVCGIDDYHWLIYPSDGQSLRLLHKGSVESIALLTGRTLADEPSPIAERIGKVFHPFRRWVMETFFGQNPIAEATPFSLEDSHAQELPT